MRVNEMVQLLIGAWPDTTKVGKALRNRELAPEYQAFEDAGDNQKCYDDLWKIIVEQDDIGFRVTDMKKN